MYFVYRTKLNMAFAVKKLGKDKVNSRKNLL